jgi:hypothetical protein
MSRTREPFDLGAALETAEERGLVSGSGLGTTSLSWKSDGVSGAVASNSPLFPGTARVLLMPWRTGLALGLFLGNDKDGGTAVAVGIAAVEAAACITADQGTPAEVARLAFARAHNFISSVVSGVSTVEHGWNLQSVAGPRLSLAGIATAMMLCLVEGESATVAHLGDPAAVLVTPRGVRAIATPHTLIHDEGYLAAVRGDPDAAVPMPERIALRAVGLGQESRPEVAQYRLEADSLLMLGDGNLEERAGGVSSREPTSVCHWMLSTGSLAAAAVQLNGR